MRKPLIAANWKMNTTMKEAVELVDKIATFLSGLYEVEVVICPPFIWIPVLAERVRGKMGLGAQNMYYEERGAYTGEISPLMIKDLCKYVILGHSERRRYFGEGDELINRKLISALKHGLNPIFCVGEELEERRRGRTEEVVRRQVTYGLMGIEDPGGLVIAYEPVWAIGTGIAASGEEAVEVVCFIRELLEGLFGGRSEAIRILYGGSVDSENIKEFVIHSEIDGALVGGASLNAKEFIGIVQATAKIKHNL